MNPAAAILLLVTGAASAATGILVWCQDDWRLAAVLGALALALIFRSSRYLSNWGRLVRLCGVFLGILMAVVFIDPTIWTDRISSFNQAVKAGRVLQSIVKKNQEYAIAHRGSFARRLGELTNGMVVGASYTIVYSPVEDSDHVIRHYSLRAVPLGTYWIRLYVDETGVVRHSDTGPADKNSPTLQR